MIKWHVLPMMSNWMITHNMLQNDAQNLMESLYENGARREGRGRGGGEKEEREELYP